MPPPYVLGPDGKPWHSWRVLILPYIEQNELFQAYKFDEPWDGPNNRRLAERMPRTYSFHGSPKPGSTTANYLAVVGDETAWPGTRKVKFEDITDGTGNTILLVENDGAGIHWMEPRDLSFGEMSFVPNAPNGIGSPYRSSAAVMLDGSVRSFGAKLQPDALRALLTARGGEKLRDTEGGWDVIEDGRTRERR